MSDGTGSVYLTTKEAAALAGVTKATLLRWTNEGWVVADIKMPGGFLYDKVLFLQDVGQVKIKMAQRKGGRGKRQLDAYGKPRPSFKDRYPDAYRRRLTTEDE